jgi:hypothetical protein
VKWEKGQREWLREWVRDGLVVAALDDDDIAESICVLAGILAQSREPLKNLLEAEMKPRSRWSEIEMIMAWIDYVHFLHEEEGDQGKARRQLIQKTKKRTGREVSDAYMANLLTKAATTIPRERFPEHVWLVMEKRLERGRKTTRRGWQ